MESPNSTTASVVDVSALKKSTALIVGVATTVAWLVLSWFLSPKIDPNEPPVVKPRIPFIGHIIDLLYYKSEFLKRIHEKTQLPAATLPMLNGKMYAIFEPAMVQSMLRNQHLSFEPFAVEFGQAELLMNDKQNKIVTETDFMKHFFPVMAPAFQGKHLVSMNNVTAQYLSDEFKAQFSSKEWKEVPNFYLWLRDMMTSATTQGLYGSHNPFRDNKALLDDIWTFEQDLLKLLVNVKPGLVAPEAHQARKRLQDVLEKYYDAEYDLLPDAAQITRERIRMFREFDFGRVGRLELALLHAATANVVPSTFWLANCIFADDKLVKDLREEIDAFVRREGNKVIVKLPDIEERCPLLNRCYKESIRLSAVGTNNRRVMEDTTLTDSNGRTYVLKKGVNVQASMSTSHRMGDIWGKNADEFDPDRFMASGMNKDKRAASHGFGGGRNLCPGRHFAYAEMMSFMVGILAGFDVESTAERADGKKWMTPDMGVVLITGAVSKPEKLGEGFGARIRCREGWEDVEWVYEA